MKWNVTYRTRDGLQVVELFEAESRDVLFKNLSARGVRAMRVAEANVRTKKSSQHKYSKSHKNIIVSAIVCFTLLASLLIFLRWYNSKAHSIANSDAKSSTKNGSVKSTKAHSPTKLPARTDTDIDNRTRLVEPASVAIEEIVSVVTNVDGAIVERFRTPDGKTHSRQSLPTPLFENATDQIIALAVAGAESGSAMPPIPALNNSDEEFKKSLERDIVINLNDSQEIKNLKTNVIAIRNQLRELIKEGQSFSDIIDEHRELVNHGVAMRQEAERFVKEFVDEGDHESARECLEKVNETLRGMGMEEVSMPLSDDERRNIIRQRHRFAD